MKGWEKGMINQVVYIGRLTKDPKLRHTSKKVPVVSFTLAVEQPKRSDLEKAVVDYIPCVAWRRWAENLCKYQRQGSLIGVKGRTQSRTYEKDGATVFVNECVAQEIQFLAPRRDDLVPEGSYEPFEDSPFDQADEELPM